MAVDTSIQFNGYNSYKFNQGDLLHCYPFGVDGMEYITHSFGAYSPIALTEKVRASTKFFDADSEILQTVDHSFDVSQGTFDKREITVSVPQGAIKAQLTFLNNELEPWWVATPKTEEGQTATPYAINAYGQLTYITPNGIYTGTITANQIVLASGDESLSDRLVTINANQIALESEVVKKGVNYAGTKITAEQGFENTAIVGSQEIKVKLNATEGFGIYANGSFIGGVNVSNGVVGLTARRIGSTSTLYGEVGTTDGIVGMGLYNLNNSTKPYIKIASIANGTGFSLIDINGNGRFIAQSTATSMRDENALERFSASSTFSIIRDYNGKIRLQVGNTQTWLSSPNGETYVYVDDTKIQMIVNGVVKETWS